MSNFNNEFSSFYEEIKISSSKKQDLIKSRNAIRDRIKNYFKEELKEKIPDFFEQGSFKIKTTLNPLDGEFDVDDGIYLNNLDEDFENWESTEEVHKWIVDATKGQTNEVPIDKNNCVRVVYSKNYHVDLPIYCQDGQSYKLASKKNGWTNSDPKGFVDWFYGKLNGSNEQMRRNILYLKAWKDYNNLENLTGIAITVLVCNNFYKDERDDISLEKTLSSITSFLELNRSLQMPVIPYDHLLENLSDSETNTIISMLKKLLSDLSSAILEKDYDKGFKKLNKQFGDRFRKKTTNENNSNSAPLIIVGTPNSKSWGNNELV